MPVEMVRSNPPASYSVNRNRLNRTLLRVVSPRTETLHAAWETFPGLGQRHLRRVLPHACVEFPFTVLQGAHKGK